MLAGDIVAFLGTAGIGKSSLFLVVLNLLFKDPSILGLKMRSFYCQTLAKVIWLYQHEAGNPFSYRLVPLEESSEETIPLFADMGTQFGSLRKHTGISLIFTSFRTSRYKELTKSGWRKVMPTWSELRLRHLPRWG
jgi:hypothetical protein